jgi:hypothetical protein
MQNNLFALVSVAVSPWLVSSLTNIAVSVLTKKYTGYAK